MAAEIINLQRYLERKVNRLRTVQSMMLEFLLSKGIDEIDIKTRKEFQDIANRILKYQDWLNRNAKLRYK